MMSRTAKSLFGSLALLTFCLLALSNYAWATSGQNSKRSTIPTPTPTVVASGYSPVETKPRDVPATVRGEDRALNEPRVMQLFSIRASSSLSPVCRLGAAVWEPQLSNVDLQPFRFGSHLDFTSRSSPNTPADIEYIQTIRIRQNRGGDGSYLSGFVVTPSLTITGLGDAVINNPGSLWIVGNEPDRDTIQDDTYPEVYAQAYHDVYSYIKSLDPTAQLANAGLVGFTPGREQYLTKVWDEYLQLYGQAMPVDVWTMHGYVLWETGGGGGHVALGTDPAIAIPYSSNCADPNSICYAEHDDLSLVRTQVERMRTWMRDHGQQNKPLLVTEFGILFYADFQDEYGNDFGPVRVSNFLTQTLDYFLNTTDSGLGYPVDGYRLVQQAMWFSLAVSSDESSASNLVSPISPYTLTQVGATWQNYAAEISDTINVLPSSIPSVIGYVDDSGTATVTLSAIVHNNGTLASQGPLTVTFYQDSSLTQVIGSGIITGDLSGCGRTGKEITTLWSQIAPGAHTFWVKVDSTDVVAETSEEDNVGSSFVLIDPRQVYLPIVLKGGQ